MWLTDFESGGSHQFSLSQSQKKEDSMGTAKLQKVEVLGYLLAQSMTGKVLFC